MLMATLEREDVVRIALSVGLLTEMADPQFDDIGAFYEKHRKTQDEWDAEREARAAAAVDGEPLDDIEAEDEENDDDAA